MGIYGSLPTETLQKVLNADRPDFRTLATPPLSLDCISGGYMNGSTSRLKLGMRLVEPWQIWCSTPDRRRSAVVHVEQAGFGTIMTTPRDSVLEKNMAYLFHEPAIVEIVRATYSKLEAARLAGVRIDVRGSAAAIELGRLEPYLFYVFGSKEF